HSLLPFVGAHAARLTCNSAGARYIGTNFDHDTREIATMWHHPMSLLKSAPKGSRSRRRNSRTASPRPMMEALEERCLLSGDVVLEWNALAIEAAKIDHGLNAPRLQFGPTRVGRVMAIVQGAIFDAVNAIDRSYTPYLVSDVHASRGASIEAAAAQAGHDTLAALYPYLK